MSFSSDLSFRQREFGRRGCFSNCFLRMLRRTVCLFHVRKAGRGVATWRVRDQHLLDRVMLPDASKRFHT